MPRLYKTSSTDSAVLLVENLQVADSYWSRAKGLLGRQKLDANEAMWFKPGNNIHTFFMKFPIDCIFLNRKLEIQKVVTNIPAFRLIGPFWKATSFIETQAGFVEDKKLKVGDQLYVVN